MRKYFSPYKWKLALNVVLRVVSAIFGLILFVGIAPFLSVLFSESLDIVKPEHFSMSSDVLMEYLKYFLNFISVNYGKIWALSFVVAVIGLSYCIKNAFNYASAHSFIKIKNNVIKQIRSDVFRKYINLPVSFYKKHKKGDLISRLSADVSTVDTYILAQYDIFANRLIEVSLFFMLLIVISPVLTAFTLVLFPPIVFLISKLSKKLRKPSAVVQQKSAEMLSISEETINGIKVIKSYQSENFWKEKFSKTNDEIYEKSNKAMFRIELASPVSEFLGTLAIMAILCIGAYFILGGNQFISPELFLTFLLILALIIDPANKLFTSTYNMKRGKPAFNRIKEVLSFEEEFEDEKQSYITKKDLNSCIEVKNLVFDYDDKSEYQEREHILQLPYLKFEKNKYYAIIGESGSGKSTLTDLLSRFYLAKSGEILIDGIDIRNVSPKDVRNLIGYVSQDVVLFNDSIFNNLLPDSKTSVDEVIEALKLADAYDFVMEKGGIDAQLTDMGLNLSGGQRQRLSIARAILKKSSVMIFDEATSALDRESEQAIQSMMKKLSENHTIIVIAHRKTSIKDADCIIEVKNGELLNET